MPSVPGALLFNFILASWASLVLVFPFSHSVCVFGSVLCLVLLFYFYVYFHLVAPQSACSISLYSVSCRQLCSLLCLYTDLYQVCISLFPFLQSYMPVFGFFP